METFLSAVILILAIIFTVNINRFYHKIFDVTYFGFKPLVAEWFICFLIGYVIAGMIGGFLFRLFGIA